MTANALASVSFFGRTQCRDRDCDVAKTGLHLRLTAMKVSGDRDAPLFDLSALSDQGLLFWRRTILKAQQVDELHYR